MQYLMWIIKAALFLLILSFAIVNTDPVTVRYYLGYRWEAPLVVVLLVAVCAGALIGLLTGLFQTLRLRRQIAALKRELDVARKPEAPVLPPSDLL
ncbi:MAG: lipopolysaccharide assembly protein LapA domain-containing protein [Burkholderiales bacterium]|nr:lipopolysaccharide assembly protein LapA domain-containing protein [Burkholderiales bacterium]